MSTSPAAVVVVGASAGGVEALSTLVAGLPANLDAAVFIVLHIPAHSPSELAGILGRVAHLPVAEAIDGESIRGGRIYVAVADRHLVTDAETVRLTRGPKECRVRPAIDTLFRSAAAAFGPRAIGVVLTGLLDDGTAGLWAIKDRGGKALVQDPETAEYNSMPKSALEHVSIDGSLPVAELPAAITRCLVELSKQAVEPSPESLQMEVHIALEGNGLKAGVMNLGKVSPYTCPDCHGVLVQIEEGSIVRFRCHTGHAFSMKTLLVEVNDAIDKGLWDTLRAIEERVMLLRKMGEQAAAAGNQQLAAECAAQADDAEVRLKPIRELVLDPDFFGHTPRGDN
jgi:two-component system, chemotaxis family, protein-glutamate methylesterase/glutaminase